MKKILLLFLFVTLGLRVCGQTERKIMPSSLLIDKTDTLGVVFLSDEMPVLIGATIDKIDKIRSIQKRDDGYELIVVNPNAFRLNGLQIDYYGGLGVSEVGRLPEMSWPNNVKNPVDFFRSGFSFQNSVNTKFRFTRANVIELAFGQNKSNNPVPYSYQDIYNATLKADRWRWRNFITDIGVSGSSRANRLTNFGASHARLFNAVLTGNDKQYPYRELPDKNDTKELLAWLKTNYKKNDFETEASLSFNKQCDKRKMGMLEPASQPSLHNEEFMTTHSVNTTHLFLRNEELSETHAGLSSKYCLWVDRYRWRRHNLDILANYSFNRNVNDVSRMNGQVFEGFRNAHEILYGASYKYSGDILLLIDLKNKHYFSNTAQNYINLFPSVSIDLSLEDFLWELNFRDFKLFGSAGRSIGEAQLVYRNYSALTAEMSAATALSSFYEDREILSQTKKMTPEIYENYEAGLKTAFWYNNVSLTFTYFNNTTRNMIAPLGSARQFFLQNIGDVRNDGFLVNASIRNSSFRSGFSINFNFSKIKSKVLNVADGLEKVALAGFTDAGAYFAEGEPLGVIFGTTYQRTGNGAIAVDDNGVPLINTDLKRIGDPTPDFTMGLSPKLWWKKLEFSFTMEYNNGGERWNGTSALMEKLTKKAAEDYIEDASYFRLSQVLLSYRIIANEYKRVVRDLKIGVSGQNLFVVSPYKGVDPGTTLFGYTTGKGLDLFNMPSMHSYHFFVNITF